MKKFDLICIGEISKDVVGTTKEFVDTGTLLDQVYNGFGSRAANVAAFASIFEKKCLTIAPIGYDFESIGGLNHMRKMGMDTSGLMRSEDTPTPLAIVVSKVNIVRYFFYEGPLQKEHARFKKHAVSILKNVGYRALIATSARPDINEAVLKIARKGVLRIFMPSHEISYYTPKQLDSCLRNCDVIKLNSAQTKIMEEKLKTDIYTLIKKYKLKVAALTNGRDGSTVFAKYSGTFIPVCKPDAEVDATGAGDSYTGAFIANYLDTADEVYSARLASSTASFTVQHVGVQEDIPSKKQVLERAKLNYGNLHAR